MSERSFRTSLPPFPPDYRASGVLLHVTSLPSPYGIGDLGPQARGWVDRLQEAGQTWWQILPLGPTGYGSSPYQPLSSFAGNWLLVSPDDLIADGLLEESDTAGYSFSQTNVDYDVVNTFKHQLLKSVWTHFNNRRGHVLKPAFEQFCQQERHWLDDFALFQALQTMHQGASYLNWPLELVRREPVALEQARRTLSKEIDQIRLAQFLIFRQANCLKKYAESRGVRLIGDLPFFVSPDSSDVWAHPELFLLDEHLQPQFVAGVPPDYFSADGQLWGNPVYDWDAMRQAGYKWCIDRVRALLAHVDLIRLDHFRGFAAAWHIEADAATALSGAWVPGPGSDYFSSVQQELDGLPFIAEDLGIITPDVGALRDQFHLPGTRVLQFAFDGETDNPYLPRNYVSNTVVYTGTHDNNTTRGWYETLSDDQRKIVSQYLERPSIESSEATAALLHLAWSSVAALAVMPLQDLLNLGEDARMNVPGQSEGNWRWRCTEEMLSPSAFQSLREMTAMSQRLPALQPALDSQPDPEVTF
ncbi:4-alpha-glucanotransferase [Gimesia algae]|uniref:4-alpha-glucanotransferase n=1 Tax=Gimesia algae TaxID=2527971 RepID=A0A517VKX4_9PLAN|nr:4-alpha-glucanotransferase [Gimesia algae]QDT93671.1 4-alpha-glucanotransferase [Gimesia algae]